MTIIMERTKIVFIDYNEHELKFIQDMVATMDEVFIYENRHNGTLCVPAGMRDVVEQAFNRHEILDMTSKYWDFSLIEPVQHNAEPRNQMQKDFIEFTLENIRAKNKVGGILPPGAGKGHPISTLIPSPNGDIVMGDLKIGDTIFNEFGGHTKVLDIYELGVEVIYKVLFSDGSFSYCTYDHLWEVYYDNDPLGVVRTTGSLINDTNIDDYHIAILSRDIIYNIKNEYIDEVTSHSIGLMVNMYSLTGFPKDYLTSSVKCRLALIKGVFAEGAHLTYDDAYYFIYRPASDIIRDQLCNLLRTVSLNPKYDERINTITVQVSSHFDELVDQSYGLDIKMPRLRNVSRKRIVSITNSHNEQARCIKVDNPTSLYLTEQYIVTHNTFMACYSAIRAGMRTLIITPTTSVRTQWYKTLISMFEVDPARVLEVKGPNDFINVSYDFVLVTQSSLGSIAGNTDLSKIMKSNRFGIKIIDEAHMFFKNTILIDSCSNICHNWYLTGTFGRSSEEEDKLFKQMYGDIKMFRVANKEATFFDRTPGDVYGQKPHTHIKMIWTFSGISPEDRKKVTSAIRYSARQQKYLRFGLSVQSYTKIVIPQDGEVTRFVRIILKVISKSYDDCNYGRTLVLVPAIYATELMKNHIQREYPKLKVGTVHSENTKAHNDNVKDNYDVIVSTVKSAGTGFDVKDLSRLIVAEQYKSGITATQVVGRLRRRDDGKDTYMYDIVDADINQLRAWSHSRRDAYNEIGKTFVVREM